MLAAIALMVLFGFGALVIDGGYLAMKRRSLQAVADAAALAGSFSLPTSATAISEARAMATQNNYTNGTNGVTVTVNSPYSSDSRKIEVIISMNTATFLGKALRINTGFVKGRAVGYLPAPTSSIFAGSTTCSGNACGLALCLSGQGFTISGGVHSNGSVAVSGNNTDSIGGALEYATGCAGSDNGPIPVASGPTATATQSYPVSWTASDFPCTYSFSSFDVSQPGAWWQSGGSTGSGGVLKPGVYCATAGSLQLNGSNITGNVTFVSIGGVIQMSGQNMSFTAYSHSTLVYTTATSNAVTLGSSNWQWTGDIYAPNGLINISGTNFTTSGAIMGSNVALSATTWAMTGTSGGSSVPYLTE